MRKLLTFDSRPIGIFYSIIPKIKTFEIDVNIIGLLRMCDAYSDYARTLLNYKIVNFRLGVLHIT